MTSVVTIAGSPSSPSRSGAILEFARKNLEAAGISTTAILVRDLDAQELIWGRYDGDSVKAAAEVVAGADGVIVATPVYKAAYSGVLKTFLDLLPQNALSGKVVLPIASGAAPTHFLAIDYALKPVLSVLGAQQILTGVYLVDSQLPIVEGVGMQFDLAAEQRLLAALDVFKGMLLQGR